LRGGDRNMALFSVKLLQSRSGVGQAKPISLFTAMQQTIRMVIFYIDSNASFDHRSCDRDPASIWTTCDAMPDRILHDRLQEKPGDLCLGGFRANGQRDFKTRSEANLFDGKIFLGDGQFFPETNEMSFREAEGTSQQSSELCDHLCSPFGLFAYDERRDGVQGIEKEMRLQLVTEGLKLGLARRRFRCQHSGPLLLDCTVMLDPEVKCAPCDENDRAFERLSGDQAPAERSRVARQVERSESRHDGAQHPQDVGKSYGDKQGRSQRGRTAPEEMTTGIQDEAGQERGTKEGGLVIHRFAHMAKWDVGDGGCKTIKRPSADLERPKSGCAALKGNLVHTAILTTEFFRQNRLGVWDARLIAYSRRLAVFDFPFERNRP